MLAFWQEAPLSPQRARDEREAEVKRLIKIGVTPYPRRRQWPLRSLALEHPTTVVSKAPQM